MTDEFRDDPDGFFERYRITDGVTPREWKRAWATTSRIIDTLEDSTNHVGDIIALFLITLGAGSVSEEK